MDKKDEALKLALEALEVATTPLAKDRQEVLRAQAAIREALAEQPAQQQKEGFASPGGGYVPAIPRPMPLDWKLVPRKATPEMLKAMDECAQEGYDERLYAGMASSVYMAAWDASPVMGTLPEQPAQQEPVFFCDYGYEGWGKVDATMAAANLADGMTVEAYYTSPPASKPWVGLTQQDINIAFDDTQEGGGFDEFARALEAKLREKNA